MAHHQHLTHAEGGHAHHFESAEHEFEASKQGMWLFMVTEVLMIGAIFVGYLIMRNRFPEAFHEAHKVLNVKLGALNTVVLILSSCTMVLGVSAAQRNNLKRCVSMLGVTVALGAVFCVVKYFEYTHKFHEGIFPSGYFTYEHLKDVPHAPMFFSFYFVMTGIHAFHVVVGMGLITWIITRVKRGQISDKFFTPVELVGFYWHFVDLVWIYLFPLLYLLG
jgi:cytochrome c oxidase subunit 3